VKVSEFFSGAVTSLGSIAIVMMITPALARDNSAWRVSGFISDYHKYHIGDVAPDIYFTPEYNIKQWKIRHLPAPDVGMRWSYMYGTYVLLDEHSHKIVEAYDSDIFYRRMP